MKSTIHFRVINFLLLAVFLLVQAGCDPINARRADSAYQKGLELEQAGQTDQALAAYTEAISLNPLQAGAAESITTLASWNRQALTWNRLPGSIRRMPKRPI
jgi:tetratricopeptide (TPR) repeat protein